MATPQFSIPRLKRLFDFYSDGMGELIDETGHARRPKDANHYTDWSWKRNRGQKPRTRLRRTHTRD